MGQRRGDGDAGTRVWDAGLGDTRPGTWGRNVCMGRRGDVPGRGDLGKRGLGDSETQGLEESGTW